MEKALFQPFKSVAGGPNRANPAGSGGSPEVPDPLHLQDLRSSELAHDLQAGVSAGHCDRHLPVLRQPALVGRQDWRGPKALPKEKSLRGLLDVGIWDVEQLAQQGSDRDLQDPLRPNGARKMLCTSLHRAHHDYDE